jgi:hypothetical protein
MLPVMLLRAERRPGVGLEWQQGHIHDLAFDMESVVTGRVM